MFLPRHEEVRRIFRRVRWHLALTTLTFATASGGAGQKPEVPEVLSHQGAAPYQIRVERNLVTVRVVVRDANGHPVANLHKEDFRLYDNGGPQEISIFEAQTSPPAVTGPTTPGSPRAKVSTLPGTPALFPQRFVALYFDDLHADSEEIGRTRLAAWHYIGTALQPQDRVAISTSSGEGSHDFTDDRAKLHEALLHLMARSRTSTPGGCPDIDEFQAYLMSQVSDPVALAIAHAEAIRCKCGYTDTSIDPAFERPSTMLGSQPQGGDSCAAEAKREAELQASNVWSQAEMQSENSLQGIERTVGRLAAMPGQRIVVLVSPGFLSLTRSKDVDTIIDRALRQNVVVNAIDAAGVYACKPYRIFDAARPDLESRKETMRHSGAVAGQDLLAALAAGTGGTYFHNSNDFGEGFQQAGAAPEIYYVLSFSPQDVKLDGEFHRLKVALNRHEPWSIEARRGYFASKATLAESTPTNDEIQKIIFSQEEINGEPVDVKTQVQSRQGQGSTVTVFIHVDIRLLRFRSEGDRHVNTLIFDTALFDRDGKYVTGKEASLELRLKDATLQKDLATGITAETAFPVAPGMYRVREIVRDTESKEISAVNCSVQVPR